MKKMVGLAVAAGLSLGASAALVRTNEAFVATWNESNGGLDSLVLRGDQAAMNWIDGDETYGVVHAYRFKIDFGTGKDNRRHLTPFGFERIDVAGDEIVSHYRLNDLKLAVRRRLEAEALVETYEFENAGAAPHYFLRGHLAFPTPFSDEYSDAGTCAARRCHAHVFTGGEVSWVRAEKMGPYPTEFLLTLEEGALDGYSLRIRASAFSNDRGDILLNAAPACVRPGEKLRFVFRLAAIPTGSFVPPVRLEQETLFPGETFAAVVDGCRVELGEATRAGEERRFELVSRGRICRAVGYVAPSLDELVERRVRFILSHQQCRDPKSPLDGAFLVYDTEERLPYFDHAFFDHNAGRERIGMGLLVARWLRKHPKDAEAKAALLRFAAFVEREHFDPATGEVANSIGRDASFERPYNAPWFATFWRELYEVTEAEKYLDYLERTIADYYRKGGAKFYPNACTLSEEIAFLRAKGRDVAKLLKSLEEHIGWIVANGTRYPPHEVKFEQSIVAPSVALLADYLLHVRRDAKVEAALKANLEMLVRFDGDQPDHRQGGVPIRHWDGYWFGKIGSYGDTLHYWSSLSARAYEMCAELTGDVTLRARAERCFRNILYLYHPDGSASCAYYQALAMVRTEDDGREFEPEVRGERFDPWANDQDWGLYFTLRSRALGAK